MNRIKPFYLIIIPVLILTVCRQSIKTTDTGAVNNNGSSAGSDNVSSGKSTGDPEIKNPESHSGLFDMKMSGYKGELFIGITDGKYYATIKFFNWGNGVPQPVTDLKVTDEKIYFKREIKTREDLLKYGGTAYFEQEFYGIFSADRKIIKGYYRYTGTQDNWEAIKK